MRRLSIVLAVCTLALVYCPTGAAFAQETTELPNPGITPDSPLYFFDELAEQIALRFTFREEARVQKALQYAEERLAEMNCMMARNNVRATIRALSGYNDRINAAVEAVETSGNQGNRIRAMVALAMAKHTVIFDDVVGEIPEEARETMTQTRERACICQQTALRLMEQEDPEAANQVKLVLRERQRNSIRVIAGEGETTSVQEGSQEATVSTGQDIGEVTISASGYKGEEVVKGEPGAGWGESSDGAGPGLENCWGVSAGNTGAGYGETSEGEGPDLQNHWVQTKK